MLGSVAARARQFTFLHRGFSSHHGSSSAMSTCRRKSIISTLNTRFYTYPCGRFSQIKSFVSENPQLQPQPRFHHLELHSMLNGRVLFSTSSTKEQEKDGAEKQAVSKAQARQVADVKILKTLASYLWMKDNPEFRLRVVAALGFLVGAKVLNVQVPFLFKLAVDWLTSTTANAPALASFTASNSIAVALFATPTAVLIGYGIAHCGASDFNELRTAVFSKVALRTIRSVSKKVFSHLHDLDLGYHLRLKSEYLRGCLVCDLNASQKH